MKLRSDCTSQKRSTRRALRSALAMAFVAGPMVAGASFATSADELSPTVPVGLNHPNHLEAGLLPYPFVQGSPTDFVRQGQAPQAKNAQKLMRLVGLQQGSSIVSNPAESNQGTAKRVNGTPQLAQPTMPSIGLEQVASSVVVTASASGECTQTGLVVADKAGKRMPPQSGQIAKAPSATQPPALPSTTVGVTQETMPSAPTLPSLPALATPLALAAAVNQSTSPDAAKTAEVASLSDSLAESLIDIEIPIDLAFGNTVQVPEPPRTNGPQLSSPTDSHLSDHDSSVGLVHPTQPPQLPSGAAETISPSRSHSSNSSMTASAPKSTDRSPQLLQTSKSLSLTAPGTATPGTGSPAVNLRLSDSPSTSDTGRKSDLHASSSSKAPMKTAEVGSYLPKRAGGMQVRIEGEPAPLVNVRDGNTLPAPRPKMEPVTRVASHAREEQPSSAKKVNATFATRTTMLPVAEPTATVAPVQVKTEQNDMKVGEAFSVGLQESQAFSTDFAIVELSVEHPSICQLLQTGEKSVSVIGMRPGSTRIAFISVNAEGERQVALHQVSVGANSSTELSLPELAKELSRSVAKMIPQSDVDVVAYKDYLLVHGYTPYESDAKKIVALVRKTSLVPVVDQVKTNDR